MTNIIYYSPLQNTQISGLQKCQLVSIIGSCSSFFMCFLGKNATFLKFKNLVSTLCEKDFEAKHFRMTLFIFFCIFE